MVFIFVTPHGRGRAERVAESNRESVAGILVDPGGACGLITRTRWFTTNPTRSQSRVEFNGESTLGAATLYLELTSSGTTKGRRTRGRVRKTVKSASERAPESASVIWIRVGPGKFIRAEGGSEAVLQAQDEKGSEDDPAVLGESIPELPASLTPDYMLVIEDHSSELPAAGFGDPVSTGGSDDCVMELIAEVYGITPSTFGSIQSDRRQWTAWNVRAPDLAVTVDADSSTVPEVSDDLSAHGEDWRTDRSRGCLSGSRMYRFSRGIANAIRGGDRASLRCDVRKGSKARLLVRSSSGPNGPLRQVICRTFGRVSHHKRALRPRSPPYS